MTDVGSCPKRPAEQRVLWEMNSKTKQTICVFIETNDERLARVQANIAYYAHPDCPARGVKVGSLPGDLASGNLWYWQEYLKELHERGIGVPPPPHKSKRRT